MQQLYKYVAARAYGLAFTASAQIIEREQLFVPAGWDSEKKIDIIKEVSNNPFLRGPGSPLYIT